MQRKKLSPPNLNNTFLFFMKFPYYLKSSSLKTLMLQYLSAANPTKRKQRVLSRGASTNYFQLMNQKQLKENIKENLSDFTINNNGSILNLRLNIIKLLHSL